MYVRGYVCLCWVFLTLVSVGSSSLLSLLSLPHSCLYWVSLTLVSIGSPSLLSLLGLPHSCLCWVSLTLVSVGSPSLLSLLGLPINICLSLTYTYLRAHIIPWTRTHSCSTWGSRLCARFVATCETADKLHDTVYSTEHVGSSR